MALTGRLLGGALNGNIGTILPMLHQPLLSDRLTGVIQTVVGELTTKPEWEPKAYAVVPFIFAIGTIIGPAIGGVFANPAASFPDIFPRDGLFGRFPWLLPNLICASFMLVSILSATFCLRETHPDLVQARQSSFYQNITEQTPVISAAGATADNSVDLRSESYGTFNEIDLQKNERWRLNRDGTSRTSSISDKASQKWLTKKIVMLTLALSIYTYHSICYDHLLPIFYQDKAVNGISVAATSPVDIPGGLGLSTRDVGVIMSVNGIIALFIQAVIFPFVTGRLGVWRVFVMVTILHPDCVLHRAVSDTATVKSPISWHLHMPDHPQLPLHPRLPRHSDFAQAGESISCLPRANQRPCRFGRCGLQNGWATDCRNFV